MSEWTTTMAAIYAQDPCKDGWAKLRKHTGLAAKDAETPVSFLTILESNGLDDALWCLRAITGKDRECRLYAVWCGRRVQHLMTDQRSINALDVAERFANGLETQAELSAAVPTPWDAAWDAARSAARSAAWDAAMSAARGAARSAAWDAARSAARGAQAEQFKLMVTNQWPENVK